MHNFNLSFKIKKVVQQITFYKTETASSTVNLYSTANVNDVYSNSI